MDKFAVFGNPIAHSKSPQIHRLFAEQTAQKIEYTAILASVETFEEELDRFFSDPNARGCNVTLPFKERAASWVEDLTPAAQMAGAVNTIIRDPSSGEFIGDNTDGEGLVQDLLRQKVILQKQRILLLGAGGASRGALYPLLQQKPKEIIIANRTFDKAQQLADLVSGHSVIPISFKDLSASSETIFDVIINSTSTSLSGVLPAIPDTCYKDVEFAYDMVYGQAPTTFMNHAMSLGVSRVSDGLGMLVGQAALSFMKWTGKMPKVEETLSMMRDTL
ncbi:shikimate dehydrogenase [Aestuariibacter sp. AA17]|uniref:Shikimate dehydrogenase (NADP(+)) n=1 Tax=Fluctibacter corallii TaxID=2984329 RepID=A0ABT3AD31_9ALTE|nr:shikimate dehydrogenase [Aestuariibacter sp. AA17]MCV2886575.1 shikimate dehydrogenase [Aestuariibacter sp. AA17]